MKTIKILFADDDLKYSMLLKRFLETEGYEVTYAGNGNIALQQFPLIKPDLVLLDINMPELNGFEVAAKIRKQNHQVLIFFLSDRSDKADRLKGFDLQANDYLAKPFYPEGLLARIRERFQCDTVPDDWAICSPAILPDNELSTLLSRALVISSPFTLDTA